MNTVTLQLHYYVMDLLEQYTLKQELIALKKIRFTNEYNDVEDLIVDLEKQLVVLDEKIETTRKDLSGKDLSGLV